MRWDSIQPDLLKRVELAPGGTRLADAVEESLDLNGVTDVLDLCPGAGVVASLLARDYQKKITCIVDDPASEELTEAAAQVLGVSDRVRVIPGKAKAVPVGSEEFQRIYAIGHPFTPSPSHENASELYRVLAPGGIVCIAGPVAFTNETPDYFKPALMEFGDVRVRTPAYGALMFSREGFHIVIAEYLPEAWDRWNEWLENSPPEAIPDILRRAIIEDGGRWLSLGLVVLRKPPRPNWAL